MNKKMERAADEKETNKKLIAHRCVISVGECFSLVCNESRTQTRDGGENEKGAERRKQKKIKSTTECKQ